MLDALQDGGKRALADALARIEAAPDAPETAALLDAAFAAPKGFSLGLTGPPGVGKSTLIDALTRVWRSQGRTVGVIAVDPSSGRSRGALLGDRTRLTTDPADPGVFFRSMAARDRLGGLAEITFPAMVLMRALYDVVIVETVGVGQSETEIAETADLIAVCAQPGSGDALQYMKAGLMEVPDLVIVTKADLGDIARRTESDLKGAISLHDCAVVPVISCAAATGCGVDDVVREVDLLAAKQIDRFARRRPEQAQNWGRNLIRSRFGTEGLKVTHRDSVDKNSATPFSVIQALNSRLAMAMSAAFE